MRKLFLIPILLFALMQTPSLALAQGMMDGWAGLPSSVTSDDHTVREEQEGKEIWEKLQVKELECKNLTDEQYDSLGEYFMGQSIGNTQRHAAMNQMMISMMGEEGERKMHVTLGKRYSGCDPDAQTPSNGLGFMPMMWMMGGGGNPMMGYSGWGGFGWIFMIVFWVLIILGVVALVRYLRDPKQNESGKTLIDILKERYAKGEINKKEFEEMKKDLG